MPRARRHLLVLLLPGLLLATPDREAAAARSSGTAVRGVAGARVKAGRRPGAAAEPLRHLAVTTGRPPTVAAEHRVLAGANPAPALDRRPEPATTPTTRFRRQVLARATLLGIRALTLPAHVWPLNRVAAAIAHGEPFAGLTPRGALRVAREIRATGGRGVVVGRLAPELRDPWSIAGAEASFVELIDRLGALRRETPGFKTSFAFDPDSLGLGLAGVPRAERERQASDAMVRIAARAKAAGVGVELDSTGLGSVELNVTIAERIVREVGVPVRLGLAARYAANHAILERWAALARETGLPLGVRLVKGSYLEHARGAINDRARLLANYRRMITRALTHGRALDIVVATQNEDTWRHAQAEAKRLGTRYELNVIRGVNPAVQAKMRAAGEIGAEYVSYGPDAPAFGISELFTAWRERRALVADFAARLD